MSDETMPLALLIFALIASQPVIHSNGAIQTERSNAADAGPKLDVRTAAPIRSNTKKCSTRATGGTDGPMQWKTDSGCARAQPRSRSL